MICQHCGSNVSDNSNFCIYCGTPVLQATTDFGGTPELAGTPFAFDGTPTPPRRLDLGKLLADTFELYKQNFGTMCLIGVLIFGIPMVFNIGSSIAQFATTTAAEAHGPLPLIIVLGCLWFLLALCQMFSQLYLTLGAIRQCLDVARGGVVFRTDLMFPPFMMFLKMLGLVLLMCLVVYGFILPGVIPFVCGCVMLDHAGGIDISVGVTLIAVGGLVTVIGVCGAIWIGVRWYLAQVFLADESGVIDSMRYSWRCTAGNFWMLLLASLVLGICAAIGYILCCVGVILTLAIVWLGAALAYLQLTGQPNCLDYAAMQHPMETAYSTETDTSTEEPVVLTKPEA